MFSHLLTLKHEAKHSYITQKRLLVCFVKLKEPLFFNKGGNTSTEEEEEDKEEEEEEFLFHTQLQLSETGLLHLTHRNSRSSEQPVLCMSMWW